MNFKLRSGHIFVIGAGTSRSVRPWVDAAKACVHPPTETHARTPPIICRVDVRRVRQLVPAQLVPVGVRRRGHGAARGSGMAAFRRGVLVAFVAIGSAPSPPGAGGPRRGRPGLPGRLCRLRGGGPSRAQGPATRQRIIALFGMIVGAGALGALNPTCLAPRPVLRQDRRGPEFRSPTAWLVFLAAVAPFLTGYIVKGRIADGGTFLSGCSLVLRRSAAALRLRAAQRLRGLADDRGRGRSSSRSTTLRPGVPRRTEPLAGHTGPPARDHASCSPATAASAPTSSRRRQSAARLAATGSDEAPIVRSRPAR